MMSTAGAEEELEELRMQKSLMEDDLQYKTQALSEKIRETHELSSQLERLRAENDRLTRNNSASKNSQVSQPEKHLRFSEKKNSTKTENTLYKSQSKILINRKTI